DQWPLRGDKLQALTCLVQEQLDKRHVIPSTSPWNSPIFVVKKKNGNWRLVHDLRKINAVIEPMGAIQPGMPSPTMIPQVTQGFQIVIIDIKDCFFQIPLHSKDSSCFAFFVPSVNAGEPAKRYQWTVLPQGMHNSPTICQMVIASSLSAVRRAFPEVILYHYMDDILIASDSTTNLELAKNHTLDIVQSHNFKISPEKVQLTSPWKYLGWRILEKRITPSPVSLNTNIKTLHDLQSLLGIINWIRPNLGINNDELQPLFQLLKGDTEL
ncbi:POK8 protein, partial [Furnarius figulus]|nr:POK8 protein [Furnarius figulus]